MKVVKATCGTEREVECEIVFDDNNYSILIDNFLAFQKNQDIYGLGFYEEKALENALKKVINKEIVKQIKEQFHL